MADQDAPEKTEETKETSEQTASKPTVLKLKRRGKEIEVPVEKAVDLAQQGLDYNRKMEQLKAERAQIEKDRQAAEVGKDLLRLKEEKPEVARQIIALANGDPLPTQTPANGSGNIPPEELDDTARALLKEIQDLKAKDAERAREFQVLSGTLQSRLEREDQQDIEGRIQKAAKAVGSEFWDEETIREVVVPEVAAYMAANPGSSAEEGVWAKHTAHKKMLEGYRDRVTKSAESKAKTFMGQPSATGTPQALPKKYDYKAEDLHTGRITKDAINEAMQWFKGL